MLTSIFLGAFFGFALYYVGTNNNSNILNMLRQRVTGDYLQTSAILDRQFEVVSAVNDINDYQGPGTGYRISAERWAEIKNIPGVVQPDTIE